ncbi:hypothetical protein [Clostridium sp. UBA1652]|uniref:hypothetical protein n=1 Tax=Clostridium sp. UBA1652 TaxID=1946348 RepID=UPI00257F668E|nr:hypothetical protein [Clostridium sp. UBA1652]
MREIKSNKYLLFASLAALVYFFGRGFINIPDVVEGFCVGLSIVLYSVGLYSINHDINKLKDGKRNLFKKFI